MKKDIVITYFKNQGWTITDIARRLGISQSAIYHWGDVVPKACAEALRDMPDVDLDFDGSLYRNRYHGPKAASA